MLRRQIIRTMLVLMTGLVLSLVIFENHNIEVLIAFPIYLLGAIYGIRKVIETMKKVMHYCLIIFVWSKKFILKMIMCLIVFIVGTVLALAVGWICGVIEIALLIKRAYIEDKTLFNT